METLKKYWWVLVILFVAVCKPCRDAIMGKSKSIRKKAKSKMTKMRTRLKRRKMRRSY
jgi:hypothetical protein